MTLTLELPHAVEEALTSEASERGLTPEQIVQEDLRQKYALTEFHDLADERPKTGADLLAIWGAEGAFLPAEEREEHLERMQQIRTEGWRRRK